MIKKEQLRDLAVRINKYIYEDFIGIHRHYSTNLMNTLRLIETNDGFIVEVPADRFDIDIYEEKGVIVYTHNGSYAEEVNTITGGFSTRHFYYVERAITRALNEWLLLNGISDDKINISGGINLGENYYKKSREASAMRSFQMMNMK